MNAHSPDGVTPIHEAQRLLTLLREAFHAGFDHGHYADPDPAVTREQDEENRWTEWLAERGQAIASRSAPSSVQGVIGEMRTMQIVAGQASVENTFPVMAFADARFAEYCGKWADTLAALVERQEQKDEAQAARVDGQTS